MPHASKLPTTLEILMSTPSFAELAAQGYNHVPVIREVFADLETPLSAYVKTARGPYSYLLESAAQGGEKWSRYSMVGLPSSYILYIDGHEVTIRKDGEVSTETCSDPFDYVATFQQQFRYPELDQLPIYTGGLVGYFSYDTVRYVESKVAGSAPPDNIGTPDILLMVSNDILVFDSVEGRIHYITHVDPALPDAADVAEARLDEMVAAMSQPLPEAVRTPEAGPAVREEDFVSTYGEDAFKRDVDRIKDYIVAGDVMQVVLSQRMSIPVGCDPINVYRSLRALNPSPYMYYMDLGDHHIVSSSPEILARLDHDEVTVRPLAGTRRRGRDEDEDLALEKELLADPKEIAEHLMLIDLGRNDIGRVCRTGTVEVSEMMVVERYAHVMHIASNVCGQILEDLTAVDLLRATLPVGTLSGAPKVRALEIIDEMEPEKRGIFGGAVGYLSWNGNMDMAIAIRTAVIRDSRLFIQAGAGVVADSVPELEWKETMNKARSIFKAVEHAEGGFGAGGTGNDRPRSHEETRPLVGQDDPSKSGNVGESS